ncbi:MAG: hypothetical protein NVSMB18_03680 [Acetobacteraceae bacterium]
MLPAEWGEVGEQVVGHILGLAQRGDGRLEVIEEFALLDRQAVGQAAMHLPAGLVAKLCTELLQCCGQREHDAALPQVCSTSSAKVASLSFSMAGVSKASISSAAARLPNGRSPRRSWHSMEWR